MMLQIIYVLKDGTRKVMGERDEAEVPNIHKVHAWVKQIMAKTPLPDGATWEKSSGEKDKTEEKKKYKTNTSWQKKAQQDEKDQPSYGDTKGTWAETPVDYDSYKKEE